MPQGCAFFFVCNNYLPKRGKSLERRLQFRNTTQKKNTHPINEAPLEARNKRPKYEDLVLFGVGLDDVCVFHIAKYQFHEMTAQGVFQGTGVF